MFLIILFNKLLEINYLILKLVSMPYFEYFLLFFIAKNEFIQIRI